MLIYPSHSHLRGRGSWTLYRDCLWSLSLFIISIKIFIFRYNFTQDRGHYRTFWWISTVNYCPESLLLCICLGYNWFLFDIINVCQIVIWITKFGHLGCAQTVLFSVFLLSVNMSVLISFFMDLSWFFGNLSFDFGHSWSSTFTIEQVHDFWSCFSTFFSVDSADRLFFIVLKSIVLVTQKLNFGTWWLKNDFSFLDIIFLPNLL